MEIKKTLKGIFSLSAASLALLQSTAPTKAKEIEAIAPAILESKGLQAPEVDKLILAPADQDVQQFAAHRSHSSHRSHASHRSHYSSYGGGSGYGGGYSQPTPRPSTPQAPAYAAPTAPAYPPAPPRPVDTNAVAQRVITAQKEWAEKGYPTFQYELGLRYLTGNGVEKDEQEARRWLGLAAVQGHPDAQKKLDEIAKTLLASQSLAKNMTSTSYVSLTNRSLPTSGIPSALPAAKKDINVLTKEAAEGSAKAQYDLALRYLEGGEVQKNAEKAKALLELSAAQGNAAAKTKLEEIASTKK